MADTKPQHPDWAQPGREVICVGYAVVHGRPSVYLGTIQRLTPTLAVLTNGEHYRLVGPEKYQEVGDRRSKIVPRDEGFYVGLLPTNDASDA